VISDNDKILINIIFQILIYYKLILQ